MNEKLNTFLHKPLHPVEALFDVTHAGGVADAEIVVSAESDTGNCGDFFLVEKAAAEFRGFEAEFGNVRKQVKGAFGIDARNAGHFVEPCVGISTTLGILGKPGRKMILGAVEGRDPSFLSKGGRVAGAVALNGIDGFGD